MLKFFFPDMHVRNIKKELMDSPDADLVTLIRTIHQFKLINMLFSSGKYLIKKYFFDIMEKNPDKTYSMLDIGAGGCDIAVQTAIEARRKKIRLNITALDIDKRIIPAALEAVKDYPEIKVIYGHAADPAKMGQFDFIFSNHFLHHLDWNEIEKMVRFVYNHSDRAFIMNDLRRSNLAYLGYTVFTGLFIHRSLAFHDGRLSIQRGFTENELKNMLIEKLPGLDIEVSKVFPARLYLWNIK